MQIFKNKLSYKVKERANTLPEMLIALILTGIVFTISLGTMVADYKKNETVVRLKKIYSVISQAFEASSAHNGLAINWDIASGLSTNGSLNFFNDYLKPSLILSQDCENSLKSDCNFVFKELDGTEKSLNPTWARFFLNDGTFVALQTNSSQGYKVVYFYVDTNGKKRLIVVARDIFLFEYWIQNIEHPEYVGKLLPYGHQYTRNELISEKNPNNCNKNTNGKYCSALIMKDQWQIIDGYPWAQARYIVQ